MTERIVIAVDVERTSDAEKIAPLVRDALRAHGVQASAVGGCRIRCVTHREIGDAELKSAASTIARVAARTVDASGDEKGAS